MCMFDPTIGPADILQDFNLAREDRIYRGIGIPRQSAILRRGIITSSRLLTLTISLSHENMDWTNRTRLEFCPNISEKKTYVVFNTQISHDTYYRRDRKWIDKVKQMCFAERSPEWFICKSMKITRNKPSPQTFKKVAYVSVSLLNRRLQVTIRNVYWVAELRILFTSRPVLLS